MPAVDIVVSVVTTVREGRAVLSIILMKLNIYLST